jgi:hypothetical protein
MSIDAITYTQLQSFDDYKRIRGGATMKILDLQKLDPSEIVNPDGPIFTWKCADVLKK